jgi:hypothetical protein
MIRNDIERPFGDDEDANRAVRAILSTVGELSTQSRRLAQTRFRNVNTMHAQRQLVQGLRDEVTSAASRVHQPADEFLEAARLMLERRLRRPITIHPAPAERPHMDPVQRELDREVLILQEKLHRSRETLKRVATRVENEERELATARAAARAHELKLLGRGA